MDINNDIFILNEEEVTTESIKKPKPIEDDGLVEQVVRKKSNPFLRGDDEIEITKSPFVIGKESTCAFVIEGDTYISRKHCRIVQKEDGYYITDLDSTNGTFIDDAEISGETKLEKGQEIRLADRNYVWEE